MKLKCLVSVPDKYTKQQYVEGETYEFEEARAKEVLAARTSITKEPYFEVVETADNPVESIEKTEVKALEDLKISELKELAETLNIEGYKKMKKAELIEAIESIDN